MGRVQLLRKAPVVFLEGKYNSTKYIQLLDDTLLRYYEDKFNGGLRFKQGNGRPHASEVTCNWIFSEAANVMDCSAPSPNLNPIENLLKIFCATVYAYFKQYKTIRDHNEALKYEWEAKPP